MAGERHGMCESAFSRRPVTGEAWVRSQYCLGLLVDRVVL
jgi:hypothetical protein